MEFTGKSAIVTGAASGIGRAVAAMLVERGARVLAVDIDADALDRAADEVGEGFVAWRADVSDPGAVEGYVAAAVERFGRIDHFFNNAGVEGPFLPVTELSPNEWEQVLGVMVNGTFYGFRYVGAQMKAQGGGSIVATGSILAVTGAPTRIDYVASKHAILGMVRTVAVEYGDTGIRANCICPGPVETPLMERAEALANPEDPSAAHRDYAAIAPMNRYARTAEVAETVLFLLGERAEFINGAVIPIDGGFCAN